KVIIGKGLENYYTDSLPEVWSQHVAELPPMAPFIPSTENAMALQFAYLADNPHPHGNKHYMNRHDGRLDYHDWHAEFHGEFGRMLDRTRASDILLVNTAFSAVLYSHRKHIDFATSLLNGGIAESRLGEVFMQIADRKHEGRRFTGFFKYPGAHGKSAGFVWAPIMNADEVGGVLFLRLDADKILQSLPETARTDAYLATADGAVLTPPSRALMRPKAFGSGLANSKLSKPAAAALKAHPETAFDTLNTPHQGAQFGSGVELGENYFGEQVVRGYTPAKLTLDKSWLITERPADLVLANVVGLKQQVWVIGGSIGGLIILAGAIVAFLFGKRVREAEETAQEIVSGKTERATTGTATTGGLTGALTQIGKRQAAVTTYVEAINRDNYDKNLPFAPDDRLGSALRSLAVRVREMNNELQLYKRSDALTTDLEQQFNAHLELDKALQAAFNHLRSELGLSGVAMYLKGETEDADRLQLHTTSGVPEHRQLSQSPEVYARHYKSVVEQHDTRAESLDKTTYQLLLPLRYDFTGIGLLQLISEYPASQIEVDVAKKVAEVISLHASLKTARSRQNNLRRSLREDRQALKKAQEELKDLQKRRDRERIELQNEIKALTTARESEQKEVQKLRREAEELSGRKSQLEKRLAQIEEDLASTRTKSEAEQRALHEAKAGLEKKLQAEQERQQTLQSTLDVARNALDERNKNTQRLENLLRTIGELQAEATTASAAAAVDLATTRALQSAGYQQADATRALPEVVVDLEQLLRASFTYAALAQDGQYEPPTEAFDTPVLLSADFAQQLADTLQFVAEQTYKHGFKLQGSVQQRGDRAELHLRLSGMDIKDELGLNRLRDLAAQTHTAVQQQLENATAEAAQDYMLVRLGIELAGSKREAVPTATTESTIDSDSTTEAQEVTESKVGASETDVAVSLTEALPKRTRNALIEAFEIGDFAQLQTELEDLQSHASSSVQTFASEMLTAVANLDYIEMEDRVYQLQD
ncbi:MAG: hypothetical protein ACOCZ8_03570, partial [Bacteroidota bacterium]